MLIRKNILVCLAVAVAVVTFFSLNNPPLNELHGRSDAALICGLFILVGLIISFFAKLKITAIITSFGYPIAFIIALIFNTTTINPETGNTNNLWIIWLVSCWVFIGLGIIIDIIKYVMRLKKKSLH